MILVKSKSICILYGNLLFQQNQKRHVLLNRWILELKQPGQMPCSMRCQFSNLGTFTLRLIYKIQIIMILYNPCRLHIAWFLVQKQATIKYYNCSPPSFLEQRIEIYGGVTGMEIIILPAWQLKKGLPWWLRCLQCGRPGFNP